MPGEHSLLLKPRQQLKSRAYNRQISTSSLINVSHAQRLAIRSKFHGGRRRVTVIVSVNLNIYPVYIVTISTSDLIWTVWPLAGLDDCRGEIGSYIPRLTAGTLLSCSCVCQVSAGFALGPTASPFAVFLLTIRKVGVSLWSSGSGSCQLPVWHCLPA